MATLAPRRALTWVRKGGSAVLDQGLFASANFAVNLMLARWLAPADYGAFALAYAVFALIINFHTAVLTEPMLVFGPGKYAERFRAYLGVLLWGHLGFAALASAGLALAAVIARVLDSPVAASAFLGLAIATPLLLLLWLARRAFYTQHEPQRAALGSGLYFLLMVLALYALSQTQLISAGTALMTLGAASAVPAGYLLWQLRPAIFPGSCCPWRGVLRDHWRYGRWSVGSAMLNWLPENVYFAVLPLWGGLEAAAALRAAKNMILPVTQVCTSASTLLLPHYVVARREGGPSALGRTIQWAAAVLSGVVLLYIVPLILFRDDLVHLLYKGQYDAHADFVALVALVPLLAAVKVCYVGGLRASERPDHVFLGHALSAVFAVTCGIALASVLGLWGAGLGQLASSIVALGALVYLFTFRNTQKG